MDEEEIVRYKKAGRIAKKALAEAREYVSAKKKINLFELCEYLEKIIRKEGAVPAFPCNSSYNEVAAHYSPLEDDIIEFKRGILKIDVGAMIDGYIADTAISVARGYEYEKMCKVNRDILNTVLDLIRPGVRLGKIGEYIENMAKVNGYRPISNLSGHKIKRYDLHAGKNVPNVKEVMCPKVEKDEVYAVEPFLTLGNNKGSVRSGGVKTIYSLKKMKRIKKDKALDRIKNEIFNERKSLPFSPRWYYNIYGKERALQYIGQLYSLGYLHAYPILIEETNGVVSQFEHTIIVLDSGNIVTTT
jgi:methionyl aminopeptidase